MAPSRLAEVLEEQFRTKTGLAKALSVSRQTVHNWVVGSEPVPDARREQIAGVLGVPRQELFPDEGVVAHDG